ncbi:MAG: Dyp-type peroxidase [Candidatus Nanopelagicales bacterium]
MAHSQPGIFAEGLIAHHHVEFILDGSVSLDTVISTIAHARRQAIWLGGPNVIWGFRPNFWRRLSPETIPDSVVDFTEISGPAGSFAPSTQFDLWVWCSSYNQGYASSTARSIVETLAPVAQVGVDLAAYKAPDSRDSIGFIDGTENPPPDEALDIALFPTGSVGEAGTDVFVQKWVHNMRAFNALSLAEQDDVFGRTKADSIQLPDDQMPATSHVSRNTVVDAAGEERHIYRRNTPFSDRDETGTQFIGLTNDPPLMDLMLDRMFGAAGDGLIDSLIRFSTPVTGSYYFVPSMQALTEMFGPLEDPDEGDDTDVVVVTTAAGRSSGLGIGSLRDMATTLFRQPPHRPGDARRQPSLLGVPALLGDG